MTILYTTPYTFANTVVANAFITTAGLDVTGQANNAYGQANAAYNQANLAYAVANAVVSQGTGNANVTISDTVPTSPYPSDFWWQSSTGALKIYYNDGISSQWIDVLPYYSGYIVANTVNAAIVNSSSYVYPTGESVGYRYTLDDISSQFGGIANSFMLTVNGVYFNVNNPNQLDITIGGVKIYPTKYIQDYVNQTEINTFNKGFFIDSSGNVNFATAPAQPMTFYGTVETNSDAQPPYTFANTPFSAINIMLSY